MKKLIVTVIGAAAAYGAVAATPITQLRFNSVETGAKTISQLNPAGATYWSDAGESASNNTYTVNAAGTVSCPLPAGDDPVNALDVKTTFGKPLSVNVVDGGTAQTIGANGIYFDSLVKFTVCDAAPTTEYADAKIVLWLQEDEANGVTNLWVKAGQLSYANSAVAVQAVDYKCGTTIGADFADNWHRVTIKAVKDITTDGSVDVPGFAIFIDGSGESVTRATCTTTDKWDSSFTAQFEFAEAVEKLIEVGALFPSLDQSTGNMLTLQSTAFDGTGSITDIAFYNESPDTFANDFVATKATVKIGDNTTEYPTLAAAVTYVNGVQSGNVTLSLAKDMTLTETLAFASAANVVFDFAGKVLTNNGSTSAISNNGTLTITNSVGNGGIVCTSTGEAVVSGAEANSTLITAGSFDGVVAEQGLGALQISGGSFKYNTMTGALVEGKVFGEAVGGLYPVIDKVVEVEKIAIAEHPWYTGAAAIALTNGLPGQTGSYVSAFHGQGEGEYLGLTYSTNPLQFDLYEVNGLNSLTPVYQLPTNDYPTAGFRGVAISKKLGVAVTLAYATSTKMYAFPLDGTGNPTEVTKPSTHSFDSAAFSPDGKYLFSNALNGESSNQYYVKWSVAVDAGTGALSLTKVGSISADGRGRNLAYARINGRDLVFALADTGKVVTIDMTGDDASAWSANNLVTDLPAHSYGSLCVSGVNATNALGDVVAPHLTVAASKDGAAVHTDVLNVYALTVPASGAVTASLTTSFNEAALTAGGFGDISDANRYGNTVFVTEDEKTIYFARPDSKLYAAQYDAWVAAGLGFDGEAYTIADEAQLEAFQAAANASTTAGKTFKLTADITLTKAWEGIGVKGGKDLVNGASTKNIPKYEAEAFCGTFDGQNHTISNFQMENGTDYGAFFNSVNGATISNLKISFKESTLCANSSSSGGDTGATFVGVARNSTLQNLTALAGTVTTVSASKDMAGIVGYLMAGSTVDSCTNELNVASLLTAKARKSGGIALITQDGSGTATIRNCKNSGTVTLAKAGGQLGGIVGYVGTATAIADCENTAAVKMVTHMDGTLTMSGVNKGNATVESCNKAIDGLNFATVDGNVATFVADNALAAGNTYKVMATGATATFAFAAAGTIAFDQALFTPTYAITAAEGLTLTDATSGTVKTYTAAVPAPPVEPISPDAGGTATYDDADAATAAAAAINANKETLIAVDSSVTGTAKETYLSKVQAVASGKTVTIQFTSAAETEVQAQVDEEIEDLPLATIAAATGDTDAEIAATPGCYYTVKSGTTPNGLTAGTPVLATGTTVTLPIPNKGAAGFYKIEVKPTK